MTMGRPPQGDREQIVDPRSGLRLEAVAFYRAFRNGTAKAVIDEVRDYFAINPEVPSDYRWLGVTRDNGQVETAKESKIHIAINHPDQGKKWPYIVLKGISGSLQDLWLGQKMGTLVAPNPLWSQFDAVQAQRAGDDYDIPKELTVGELLGGKATFNVKLEVGTVGSGPVAEDNIVTDLLLNGLVVAIRRNLSARGIEWIPNTNTMTDEDVGPLQGVQERTKESKVVVGFSLWCGWEKFFVYTAPVVDDVLIKRSYLSGREPPLPEP